MASNKLVAALRPLYLQLRDGELQLIAAALSFSTVLAILPLFAVTLSMVQTLDGFSAISPKVESYLLQTFQGPLGAEGVAIMRRILSRISSGKLGWVGSVALVLTSTLLISQLERALHRVWHSRPGKSVMTRFFLHWVSLLAFPFFLALIIAFTTAAWIPTWLPKNLLFSLWGLLALAALFRWVPNAKVTWRQAFVGAATATLGLYLLTSSFRWVSQTLFSYSAIYGSLAALPTLLVFVNLFWNIVLFGAASAAILNAQNSQRSGP